MNFYDDFDDKPEWYEKTLDAQMKELAMNCVALMDTIINEMKFLKMIMDAAEPKKSHKDNNIIK